MDLAKLIQMIGPERLEHTGPGGGAIQHEHAHAHVVINPRDMSPGSARSSRPCCCRSSAARTTRGDGDGDDQAG